MCLRKHFWYEWMRCRKIFPHYSDHPERRQNNKFQPTLNVEKINSNKREKSKLIHIMKKNYGTLMQISIVLFSSMSFLLWNHSITSTQAIVSERWIIDRLLFSRITFVCCSLYVLIKKPLIRYRYFIGTLTGIAIMLVFTQSQSPLLNYLIPLWRWMWCILLFKKQKNRIARKRSRTWMLYAFSSISSQAILVALLSAIALIWSLEKTNIQCDSFITLWRIDYLNTYLLPAQTGSNTNTGSATNVLWIGKQVLTIWTTALKDIFSLLNEQKYTLQSQTCAFINTQIEQLKNRPQRKFAWIFLLYVFLRPVFSVLFWLGAWVQRCLWKILTYYAIIKKTAYQDTINWFSL